MSIIKVNAGYLVVNNDSVDDKIHQELINGTLWDYISDLIEKDLAHKEKETEMKELMGMVDSIKTMLEKGATAPAPVKENTEEPKPSKPVKAKTKKVPSNFKMNGFLAAANKAKEFR